MPVRAEVHDRVVQGDSNLGAVLVSAPVHHPGWLIAAEHPGLAPCRMRAMIGKDSSGGCARRSERVAASR